MRNVYDNILQLIGNTPLILVNRLNPNPNVDIYAKLESQNPGGSVKDQDSIDACDQRQLAMVITGHRHFRH